MQSLCPVAVAVDPALVAQKQVKTVDVVNNGR